MSAIGVNRAISSKELAQAGISRGDVVWLNALRNSPVSRMPIYQRTYDKVQAFVMGRQNGMVTAG